MNILILLSTNRRQGTICNLCEQFRRGALENGHQVTTVNLYDYDIKACIGCWACVKTNTCIHQDDFVELFEKFEAADVIVLGAPCYWGNIPGILKTFFDRHTAYAMYKPIMAKAFSEMKTFEKIKLLKKEMSNFGPPEKLRGKGFIRITALTLPFPQAHLSGDLSTTLKAMKIYMKNLHGKSLGKLVYTDTLFKFRKNKESKMMNRAYQLGRKI